MTHGLLNSCIWTGKKVIADQHEAQRKESAIATAVDKAQYDQSRVRKQRQQLSHLMYGELQYIASISIQNYRLLFSSKVENR